MFAELMEQSENTDGLSCFYKVGTLDESSR